LELSTLVGAEAEAVLASLGSSPDGLSPMEAERRLARYGRNELGGAPRRPLAARLVGCIAHGFALLLWAAACLAWLAHLSDPTAGMDTLAAAIVGVILVNGLFAFIQEYRAERMLVTLARLLPGRARVVRSGRLQQVPVECLVPGDVILLEAGDIVPADARLLTARGLRLDLATLTGEAVPRARSAAPCAIVAPHEAPNLVLAGTSVLAGEGRAVVFATGRRTEFGRIATLAQTAPEIRSPFFDEIARVSRAIGLLALGLGALFLVVGLAAGLSTYAASVFALGVIVANVPEGLLPTVTLALAMAAQRLARKGVLVRHLPAIETLGAASVIVTDKTGTLTSGRMTVRLVQLAGWPAAQPIETLDPADRTTRRFLEIAASCHGLRRAERGRIGDPMELALVAAAEMHGVRSWPVESTIPFDADRKRMGTAHRVSEGRALFCKGAPESVLSRCSRVAGADGARALDARERTYLLTEAAALADRGYRLLALAERSLSEGEVPVEEDLTFLGFVALEDPPRPGVAEAVATARGAGIRVVVATGDHPVTAVALARKIGLLDDDQPRVVTGDELARLSWAQLQHALETPNILFARLAADQKLRIVEALQARGETVAVTGDGVNDAPALERAEIGVAMGRSGSDVAREAADIVLVDDDFAAIVAAIAEGRAVFANVRKFLTYILTSNVPELVPFLAFAFLGVPLPLTVVQILAVDLGTDLLPALALGAEPPGADTMRRPPRPRGARLIDPALLLRAYGWLGPLQALGAISAYASVLVAVGWRYGQTLAASDPRYLEATTATLAGIVLAQMANLLVCRDELAPAFDPSRPHNPLLLPALATEGALILLIVYTPLGWSLFATAPLGALPWAVGAGGALLLLAAEETRKAFRRRRGRSPDLRTPDR
jgi:sodium/potassium-transporting ATPase subunit alpha